MNKNNKKVLVPVALGATFLFLLIMVTQQFNDLSLNETISVKPIENNLVYEPSTDKSELTKRYAKNMEVMILDKSGNIVAEDLITGNGSVSINSKGTTYEENGIKLTFDNLYPGVVNVVASKDKADAQTSFRILHKFQSIAERRKAMGLNIYDGPSYARPDEDRDIMSAENGYKNEVYDEGGKVVGTVSKNEILGTNEADKIIESLPDVSIGEVDGNQYIDSKPAPKPTPTPTPTPEPEVEVPTVPQEPAPEVTPEPTPEVITPEINGESSNEGVTISSAYDRIVILTDGDPIVFFGSGTETLVIEDASSFSYTDNGDGTITCEYGVFNK